VDHPDQLEKLAHKDLLENQECQLSQKHLLPASQERPETKVHLAHPDSLDHQEPTVHQDLPDPRENLAQMEPREPTVNPDQPDPLDLLELPARRVFARNTVPPMEVSSSRTEHADKLDDVSMDENSKINKDTRSTVSKRNFFVYSRLFFNFMANYIFFYALLQLLLISLFLCFFTISSSEASSLR